MLKTLAAAFVASCLAVSGAAAGELVKIPAQADPDCRGGSARLFDECSDQTALFAEARRIAAAQGKAVLVSYGAEWCIWCHVFDQYVQGGQSRFEYRFASPRAPEDFFVETMYERESRDVTEDAAMLRDFVADHFVMVKIENRHAEGGRAVLADTGAEPHFNGGVPFIFAVDREGRFADALDPDAVETRRDTEDWYRGYDRWALVETLGRLHRAASR